MLDLADDRGVEDDHPEVGRTHEGGTSVRSPTMKIDADEKELLESVERGEWKSATGGKRERARYRAMPRARSGKIAG